MKGLITSSVLAVGALLMVSVARADLQSFIHAPDPVFSWRLESTQHVGDVTVYKLHLVSQMWHGFKWEHDLVLFRPDKSKHPEFCALHNTGGSFGGETAQIGKFVVEQTGLSFAVLYGIPMQPIWGKSEDALVVATWLKFIQTGDPTWPLHLPMANAVIKAMDALQQFSKQDLKSPITKFSVNGASKRGWTTWLVGAAQDPRVVSIAPMVIDTLNLPAQIPHEYKMYNGPSEQIEDYTSTNILQDLNTPRGKELMKLEDPYSYRDELTLPKLIILGTNDRYWPQDALNLYWDDLKGPKWVIYDPNSGHGLDDRMRVLHTLAAFLRYSAGEMPFPKMTWHNTGPGTDAKIDVESDIAPVSARVWRVESKTTDFRDSKWTSTEVPVDGKKVTASLPCPASGYAATFVELTFDIDGKPFNLSTQLRILPQTK